MLRSVIYGPGFFLIGISLLLPGLLLPAPRSQAQPAAEPLIVGLLAPPESAAAQGAELAVRTLGAQGLPAANGEAPALQLLQADPYPQTAAEMLESVAGLRAQGAQALISLDSPSELVAALAAEDPLPLLTLSRADHLLAQHPNAALLRLRASEAYYSRAAADYLYSSLNRRQFVLLQSDLSGTEGLIAFENALVDRGLVPLAKLQSEGLQPLLEQLPAVLALAPDSLALWGDAQALAAVQALLQAEGWQGSLYYRSSSGQPVAAGVISAASWLPNLDGTRSQQFTAAYEAAYRVAPNDEAAAAYDAVLLLLQLLRYNGSELLPLDEALLQLPAWEGVQGSFFPHYASNGELARQVVLYQGTAEAEAQVLARYDNDARLRADQIALLPTPSPMPSLSPSPLPPTLTPTPLPPAPDIRVEGVTLFPPQPRTGESFMVNVGLRNYGTLPTGAFTVTAVLAPGPVYANSMVENLDPGASTTLSIPMRLNGGGNFRGEVMADSGNMVLELNELDNAAALSYSLLAPLLLQNFGVQLQAGSYLVLHGSLNDLEWTGQSLRVLNGAQLAPVLGTNFANASPANLDFTRLSDAGVARRDLFAGAVLGMITAEGHSAILGVDSLVGDTLTLSYRVYGS